MLIIRSQCMDMDLYVVHKNNLNEYMLVLSFSCLGMELVG